MSEHSICLCLSYHNFYLFNLFFFIFYNCLCGQAYYCYQFQEFLPKFIFVLTGLYSSYMNTINVCYKMKKNFKNQMNLSFFSCSKVYDILFFFLFYPKLIQNFTCYIKVPFHFSSPNHIMAASQRYLLLLIQPQVLTFFIGKSVSSEHRSVLIHQ